MWRSRRTVFPLSLTSTPFRQKGKQSRNAAWYYSARECLYPQAIPPRKP